MLQAWVSIGYIFRSRSSCSPLFDGAEGSVLMIAALVVGIPLWFGWEYARPHGQPAS